MPTISRTGGCPPFLEYITRQALIPRATGVLNSNLQAVAAYGGFRWIDIPSYQRGVVWDDARFEDLIDSRSPFLGNAILGAFPVDRRAVGFADLPASTTQFEILIDGLQRFTIGTALLSLLDPFVFQIPPLRAGDAAFFGALAPHARMYAPVFQHNDFELTNHPRRAVRDSYRAFRSMLGRWLSAEFQSGHALELAAKLNRLFLERQIAPDTYHGFNSVYEVTSTFIGLNTVRVQLDVVDWLRSVIVDRGATAPGIWSPASTEVLENQFTEVFCGDGGARPIAELRPFANEVLDQLVNGNQQTVLFPSWNTGLLQAEVEEFLGFVRDMYICETSPYLNEIRECGAGPFAVCLAYYYREFRRTGQMPTVITGGHAEDGPLHTFLRSSYRMVLDGHIGRTTNYVGKALVGTVTLDDISNSMSLDFPKTAITQPLDHDWLKARLREVDKKDAPRLFNACLMSKLGHPLSFSPQTYGREAAHYQIDHMIPESVIQTNQPGESECHLIMNFSPLRRHVNNKQTNLPCSQKLGVGGTYANECVNDPGVHPFVQWTVHVEAGNARGALLDRQDLLVPGANPALGDERIAWLVDILVARL